MEKSVHERVIGEDDDEPGPGLRPAPHHVATVSAKALTQAAQDFLGEDETSRGWQSKDWVIKGFIPRDGVTFLAGPPKVFKTFFALEAALCIESGTHLFRFIQ